MTLKKFLREWVLLFAVEFVVILLILQFGFYLTVVPTGSMAPTFTDNSWLFVTRMYVPHKTVKRGDIVVFKSDELQQNMVKRVIGLPGEHVELDDRGRLYIDGVRTEEPYVFYPSDDSGTWDVPQDGYLFMGDNRANSLDARFWDTPIIPANKLQGEARLVLWPISNFGFLK